MDFVHWVPGGGLGDVFRELYYHNALGILKRWKLQHPTARLTLGFMSHNPNAADFVVGQEWIDEVKFIPFPLDKTNHWWDIYTLFPEEFTGKTELRITIPEYRSNYRSADSPFRIKLGAIEQVLPVGTTWEMHVTPEERAHVDSYNATLLFHPFAGHAERWLPEATRERLLSDLPPHTLIAADYTRLGHEAEVPLQGAATWSPRQLWYALTKAKAVVATESSVYYMASMMGVPTAMYYAPNCAFDKMVRGDRMWDWFFNTADTRSLFLPLADNHPTQVVAWAQERVA